MKPWYNDGLGDNAIKNQFTAYLQVAVRRRRITYHKKKEAERRNELIVNQNETMGEICDKPDMLLGLPILDQIENPYLQRLLKNAKPIEKYIIYARAIENRSFHEIAKAIGKKSSTISVVYHRTIKKFNKEIMMENSNDF